MDGGVAGIDDLMRGRPAIENVARLAGEGNFLAYWMASVSSASIRLSSKILSTPTSNS